MELQRTVHSEEETSALGQFFARQLQETGVFSLLFRGPLGCGKTALVRALVPCLPGGGQAEVSSPSFTLCNEYPTEPPVLHCDLYRAGEGALPDELADAVDSAGTCCLIEWSEFLNPAGIPDDYVQMDFDIPPNSCEKDRALTLHAHGPVSSQVLAHLLEIWPAEKNLSPDVH